MGQPEQLPVISRQAGASIGRRCYALIPTERWRAFDVPVSSEIEQGDIVNFINSVTAQTDDAIRCARREIDLLREYRTCLIADVVTGKLDIREAASRLPDDMNARIGEAGDPDPVVN